MAVPPTPRTRSPRKRGRPLKVLEGVTQVGSQLISWALPGGQKNKWEMASPDDLLTRRGWPIYREMMADDQVKAALWYKKVLLCARPFDLTPASEEQVDKDAAQFVHDNFLGINFQHILWEMLSAFEFGFSAGEILWEIKPSENIKKNSLMLHLRDVKFRDPEYMFIRVDIKGNIIDFIQKPPQAVGKDDEIIISPEKILHYAYQRQFSNHYGISDLRSAYRAWWSKKYVTQFWNIYLERFGSPLMMMKYPQGTSEKLKNALKSIMSNLSSKTDVLVPEGVEVELIEATRGGTAGYSEALTYYDVRIATAILIPALLGMGVDTKRGSDSQSRLHLRTLMKLVQFLGNEVAEEIQDKIIDPIVEANFITERRPRFTFQDYGEFEAFEITDAIKEMWAAGILDLDQEDVNLLRSITGLPIRSEDHEDELLRPDPSVQPGAGAEEGNDNAGKPVSSRKTDTSGRTRPSRRKGN